MSDDTVLEFVLGVSPKTDADSLEFEFFFFYSSSYNLILAEIDKKYLRAHSEISDFDISNLR
jgi:hypothetical protein